MGCCRKKEQRAFRNLQRAIDDSFVFNVNLERPSLFHSMHAQEGSDRCCPSAAVGLFKDAATANTDSWGMLARALLPHQTVQCEAGGLLAVVAGREFVVHFQLF